MEALSIVDKDQLIVSEAAMKQMGNCILFIAQENAEAARKIRKRLVVGIRSLEEMPVCFPFFNEPYIPANKYHKIFIENWQLILYQIRDMKAYVDYGGRLPPGLSLAAAINMHKEKRRISPSLFD